MADTFDWGNRTPRTGELLRWVGGDGECDTSVCDGDIVTVIETRNDTDVHFKVEDGDTCTHDLDCFEPVNKETYEMSDVKTVLKNTKLTADDRLLRKEGLEDENGNMTSTGKDVLLERLWAAERTKLAADLKAARKQEKAEGDDESE